MNTNHKPGKLIIVNGASSAGKTSLCKALQDIMPECYMFLGIDLLLVTAFPPKQLDLEQVDPEYYSWSSQVEADGKPYFTVTPGAIMDQATYARYRAIKAYLDAGMNVMADDVIWKRAWLLDMIQLLQGYHVTFVGAYVSDAEGARREEKRGDRYPGCNRGSARLAHTDAIYDVVIDTTDYPPSELAEQLKTKLAACPQPKAFEQLRRKFLEELEDRNETSCQLSTAV